LKFTALTTGYVFQKLGIGLGVDWFKEFYLWLRASVAATLCLTVGYYFTDETSDTETFVVDVANTWEKKVLSPASGKYIEAIQLYHDGKWDVDTWVDDLMLVF